MNFQRHVSRSLHEDHVATIAILERLETLLGRHRATKPPDAAAPEVASLLKDLIRAIDAEIGTHFAFEEEFVFPRLAAAGDSEMGAVLIDEHKAILPLAKRLVEAAQRARAGGFSGALWAEFHGTGAELVERLVSHIQKEEMGLLPALDDLLDDEGDGALALELAARR
jgi:iron-sulfur cluster repair protein YtfE (RIC family)